MTGFFCLTINKSNVMFLNLFKPRVCTVKTLFFGHYIDPKVFYTVQFNKVPCISFIGELDISKASEFIQSTYCSQIREIYQHTYFDHDTKQFFFNNALLLLKNKRMIELATNYCQVLHTKNQYDWVETVIKELSVFHLTNDAEKSIGFARTTSTN